MLKYVRWIFKIDFCTSRYLIMRELKIEKLKNRMRYYDRNGWDIIGIIIYDKIEDKTNFEKKLKEKDKNLRKQWEVGRIDEAKYNKRYKEIILIEKKPKYLEKRNIGDCGKGEKIRILVRLRLDNMKEGNKYWLEDQKHICVSCKKNWDNLYHYIGECEVTKNWFKNIGNNIKS
ncbi:hypothetical protein ACFW04_011872 [Cataglyphis niger]